MAISSQFVSSRTASEILDAAERLVQRRGFNGFSYADISALLAYCNLYRSTLRDESMCLCGMLAAEYDTSPPQLRNGIVRFFDRNRQWLAVLLEAGRRPGPRTLFFNRAGRALTAPGLE